MTDERSMTSRPPAPPVAVDAGAEPNGGAERAERNSRTAARIDISHTQHFSGPLPPPDVLVAYERAHPGLAERLVNAFESETEHRRTRERKEDGRMDLLAKATVESHRRGQWMAFGLGISALIVAIALALKGEPVRASIAAALPFGGVAAVAAYLRHRGRSQPADDKQQ